PLAARAQQGERMRRIGVLMGLSESDPEAQSRIAAFRKTLQGLGWTEGRNVQADYYWAAGDIDRTHALAKELVSSAPDVIVVNTPPGLSALRVETHTIPIVFVQVLDASESTVVLNPACPESNVTGFTNFYEYAVSGKWLALLKEIAPSVSRVGKEEDIGGDDLEARPRDRAETETSGEDISSLVVQGVVGRALRLGDEDRWIRAKKARVG